MPEYLNDLYDIFLEKNIHEIMKGDHNNWFLKGIMMKM